MFKSCFLAVSTLWILQESPQRYIFFKDTHENSAQNLSIYNKRWVWDKKISRIPNPGYDLEIVLY